jgi:Spy/CpxP family protein refolding chaperone
MGSRGGVEEGDGPRAERWEQRLNLTPEQRQRINSIRSQNRDQMRSLVTELRQARQRFSELLSSNASDSEIRQQRQRVESLSQRLRDARFDSMLQVRSVLTPQQRQELAQQMEQRRERWGKRSGKGSGFGPAGQQGGDRPAQPIPVF